MVLRIGDECIDVSGGRFYAAPDGSVYHLNTMESGGRLLMRCADIDEAYRLVRHLEHTRRTQPAWREVELCDGHVIVRLSWRGGDGHGV